MSESYETFQVYTDGSCYTGDRIGAWAYVIVGPELIIDGGSDDDTTISRMELLGPIDALEYIYNRWGPSSIKVYSDSQYVVLGITNRGRARNKNNDLWEWLDEIVDTHHEVVFEHVKGHAGNEYNELADEHAGKLRAEAQAKHDVPPNSDIQRRFEQFHEHNPHVYDDLVDLARKASKKGRKRISIETLYGYLRWNHMMTTEDPESEFKLNDHYTSRYARKIMAENPDLHEIFKVRELRS